MSLKDSIEHGLDAIKKGAENVKDTIDEKVHHTAAEGEHAKRDLAGDEMTLGEKAGSVFNEGKENTLAGVDAAKRDVRSNI